MWNIQEQWERRITTAVTFDLLWSWKKRMWWKTNLRTWNHVHIHPSKRITTSSGYSGVPEWELFTVLFAPNYNMVWSLYWTQCFLSSWNVSLSQLVSKRDRRRFYTTWPKLKYSGSVKRPSYTIRHSILLWKCEKVVRCLCVTITAAEEQRECNV